MGETKKKRPAKKKSVKTPKPAPVKEQEEFVETSTPKLQYYTAGLWHGMPNYKCTRCGWSVVKSERAILEHVAKHIEADRAEAVAAATRVAVTDTGLVDPSGDKIVRKEVVEDGTD